MGRSASLYLNSKTQMLHSCTKNIVYTYSWFLIGFSSEKKETEQCSIHKNSSLSYHDGVSTTQIGANVLIGHNDCTHDNSTLDAGIVWIQIPTLTSFQQRFVLFHVVTSLIEEFLNGYWAGSPGSREKSLLLILLVLLVSKIWGIDSGFGSVYWELILIV